MRAWTRNLLIRSWSVVVLVACSGGQTGDESSGRPPDAAPSTDAGMNGKDLFTSLRQSFGNYDAATSVAELAERSDRVAVGTLAAVRAGHTQVGRGVRPNTAVMELVVSETLKGEPAERLDIEVSLGQAGFDVATVPDPLPQNRLLVFLIAGGLFDAGMPDVMLYTPTTPQGMVVEDAAAQADAVDAIFLAGPFDDLVAGVRAAVQ